MKRNMCCVVLCSWSLNLSLNLGAKKRMSGTGDGYVGAAQDAVRIRLLEKQREAERRKIQELKTKSASDKGQPGLLQFGSSTSEVPRSFNFYLFFSSFGVLLFKITIVFTFLEFQILETAFKVENQGQFSIVLC